MSKSNSIKFSNSHREFFVTLNKRVNDYFKTNQIDRHANGEMISKTVVMFSLYLIPYGLILGGVVSGTIGLLLMVVVMSVGIAMMSYFQIQNRKRFFFNCKKLNVK